MTEWLPALNQLQSLLNPAELARASRFHFHRDRDRYAVRVGATRQILAASLDCAPAQVRFKLGPKGKPHLDSPRDRDHIEFNVSHSGGLILMAVTRGVPVGVDVEEVKPVKALMCIANSHFSADEARCLAGLAGGEQTRCFHRLWTAKEAVLKTTGDGIMERLGEVEVEVEREIRGLSSNVQGQSEPGVGEEDCRAGLRRLQLLQTPEGWPDAREWTLLHFEPATGYVASLALPAQVAHVDISTVAPVT